MSKPLKLVIFDCDGTLVDSQHMIVTAMIKAYGAHGIPLPEREVLLSVVGLSLTEAFTKLGKRRRTISGCKYGRTLQRRVPRHARSPARRWSRSIPGAADAIRVLARREDVVLGIATGKSQRGVRLVLGHHGLLDHFITIKTADDAPSKPDPGMVLGAMREAGAAASRHHRRRRHRLRHRDGARGRRSGLGVTWGYHPAAALSEAGALAVIDAFATLVPALDRIWTA